FFFQAEDGIRDFHVTGVQTCALPICPPEGGRSQGVKEEQNAETHSAGRSSIRQERQDRRCPCRAPLRAPVASEDGPPFQEVQGRSEERRVGKERTCRSTACQ